MIASLFSNGAPVGVIVQQLSFGEREKASPASFDCFYKGNNMSTKIDDEFAFLDVPAGGVDLDSPPDGSDSDKPAASEVAWTDDAMIMNPMTMSLCDTNDIDSLIHACVDAKQQLADLHCFEDTIRRRLGECAKGDTKTRRVQGKTLRAKIEMPDENWDQTILKEAWQSYEKFRESYLKIGTINVQKREFNKLTEMSTDDPAFGQFKSMLEAAVRPATGAPRVTLESTK